MASSAAKKCSFLFLLALLFSQQIQARDSQFFNKVSSTTTNDNVVPNKEQPLSNNQQQQEPKFLPENENGYGLYGHESGQLPPSATTKNGEPVTTTTSTYNTEFKEPQHKYLPKNYNPVAYVTEPEDINDGNSFAEETYTNNLNNNNNNYYNDAQNYYNNNEQQEEETSEPEYRRYTSTNNRYNNYRYNGGSSFNSDPKGLSDTKFMGGAATTGSNSHFYHGGEENEYFQPQGMSDTRLLENGKYFYDVNTEKYGHNHPYESLKGVRARNEYNDRNYYGNSENSIGGRYQNQYEFQDEENMP